MSNVIAIQKKQPEPRVSGENTLNGQFTGAVRPLNTQHDGAKRKPDGSQTAAFFMVRDILNSPQIITQTAEKHVTETKDVLTGALCIAKRIMPGSTAPTTELVKKTASEYPQFSLRMLTDKCKPALMDHGILVKMTAVKYRWATVEELAAILNPDAETAQNLQQDCNGTATTCNNPTPTASAKASGLQRLSSAVQSVIDNHQRKKAQRDPWADVLPDGTIKRHRKAFSGEYTAEEKKAIRDAYERNSYAKLIAKNPELTDDAKALAQQKQLEMIERKAAQAAQMDTLKMWGKVIGFLLAAYWVAGTVMQSPAPIEAPQDDFIPGGIYSDNGED